MDFTCPECGYEGHSYKSFALHYSKSHGGDHPLVARYGIDTLREWYSEMSANQLADHIGVSNQPVRKMLKETDGLDYRRKSEAAEHEWAQNSLEERRERTRPAVEAIKTDHATVFTTKNGYESIATHEANPVCLHRLVAVAEYGFDAVDGMHVHHKNRIPWDNRGRNIELKSPSDHAHHHHEHRGGLKGDP